LGGVNERSESKGIKKFEIPKNEIKELDAKNLVR